MPITLKRYINKVRGKTPADMPMVQYWKHKTAVDAKLTTLNGQQVMMMEGEKEIFPGYPRGHILFGRLSKLKHEIKNQIFNASWHALESGVSHAKVVQELEVSVLPKLEKLFAESKYDMIPPSRMSPAVREIHRAWPTSSPNAKLLRDMFCHIMQEDDAYRFRMQWMAQFFRPKSWGNNLKRFEEALKFMEHAEVIDDMKERQRLWRRILMLWCSANRDLFEKFVQEVNWKKVQLTDADKYHFRGKYFKVDLDQFEY